MLGGGDGAVAQRLEQIEAGMWQTYQALPKNAMRRLEPRAVRYLVHAYFASEHGWLIKGLGPHGMQLEVTEMHTINILQDKAPALVEALLEAKRTDHGLSLADVVAMAAALERLIFNESIMLLSASYALNGFSTADQVDENSFHNVLTSYLLVFERGVRGNLSDISGHQKIKSKLAARGGSWLTLVEFEEDAVRNFGFSNRDRTNPFAPPKYSFEAATQLVENIAVGYGKWQNNECRSMKEELMALDHAGFGRVPLGAFYSQPKSADYQFTESVDYLRQIGALEEDAGSIPQVRIANYIAGPSNCIASSSYYSVCCLNDCESLMNELEGKTRAPTASPEKLLSLVGNLSSFSVDAPRELSKDLQAKLRSIASQHGGDVLLHGRLFAQFMHFAFPNECSYPHMATNAIALTPEHWQRSSQVIARPEERQQHILEAAGIEVALAEPTILQWSEDEVLPLYPQMQHRSAFANALRIIIQLSVLVVMVRVGVVGASTLALVSGQRKKTTDFELPLRA